MYMPLIENIHHVKVLLRVSLQSYILILIKNCKILL